MAERIPSQVLEQLAAVPLFSMCNKKELRAIARLGTSLAVPDGTVLTRQGAAGFEFFLVVSGRVRCLVDDRQVATLGDGDFFGEMALLDDGPRHATTVAEGDVRLLVLDRREFSSLLSAAPVIAQKLLRAFAVRARANAAIRD